MKQDLTLPNEINLLSELKNLQEIAIDYITHSKARNTLRAYDSDWSDFEEWASGCHLESRPAKPETVALYITHLASTGYKPSTIQRRLVAISQRHKSSGFVSPTQAQIVRVTLKGIRRALGVKNSGKSPLLTEHLSIWVDTLPDGVFSKRDKALILLGYAGALRRQEIVALNREDISLVPQGLILSLSRSKNDQESQGQKIGIPYGQSEFGCPHSTCPVRAVLDWINVANIQSGALFRRIRRGGHVTNNRLNGKSVSLIVKKLCNDIGLNPKEYSAHSLRIGHITQARTNGADEHVTMRHTRHKSLSVFRSYVREIRLFENNPVNKLGL